MFAQVFPLFQDASHFTTVTSVYGEGGIAAAMGSTMPTVASPTAQGLISVVSFCCERVRICLYIKESKSTEEEPMERRDLRGYERLSGGYGESKIKKHTEKIPYR